MRSWIHLTIIVVLLVFFSSCASQPRTSPTSTVEAATTTTVEATTTTTVETTTTTTVETTTTTTTIAPVPEKTEEIATPPTGETGQFDPLNVTAEVKTATFGDAKALIERLNTIIQSKNIDQWLSYLTDEYRAYYSDPVVLANLSESSVLKRLGLKLKTISDYFMYVVYPSRQNARLDDIDFLGADRIVALTVSSKGERLVLYYLERKNDLWKIGIGR